MKIKFLQDFRGVWTNENYFTEGTVIEIGLDQPNRITEDQARKMEEDGRVKILKQIPKPKKKTAKKEEPAVEEVVEVETEGGAE